jgi:hypothetical protein
MKVNYEDIPVISRSFYRVTCPWEYLLDQWVSVHGDMKVELQPDFQRGYVWTREQQISYVENMLRGHVAGREVFFNHPTWGSFEDADKYPIQCVDGQQRIGAVAAFLENRLPIFEGHYFKDIEGSMPWDQTQFYVNVNNLKSRKAVLQWYIDLNSGGTVHTSEEIERVKRLLAAS